ncbi:hypothetical protein A3Q56_02486 [Intoshia linei]|uniref:Cytochrome c oxidase assembly factor 3 mitochondrial coiled-coil domain-containing protein n=1 Tax=Intoshia linei TaxID=1819745 RepID=A0A177B619_9BILA|nr:hypothetical protein A3Q56_02486 [Intoshia linei]
MNLEKNKSSNQVQQTERMKLLNELSSPKDNKMKVLTEQDKKIVFNKHNIHYTEKLARLNKLRADSLNKFRYRNRIVGLSALCGVIGIYIYSMKAVGQETFLDKFQ